MNTERFLETYDRIKDAPDSVERMRRFVLDLAVRGKLVDQNSADVSALELVERIATERSRLVKSGQLRKSKISPILDNPPFDLPSKWEWVHLGAIFIYDAGIKRNPKDLHVSSWLLELEDIEKDSGQLLQRIRVSERDSRSTKSEFRKDDILYGKLRPYLNKVLVADCPGYSTTEIVAIRSVLPMNSEYCALALRRPDFVGYVTRLGQGTKMPRLRTQDAVSAPFPLPPLEEQHRIVAKVDELMTLCDRIGHAHTKRELTREKLTVSCLGRLTDSESSEVEFRSHAAFVIDNIKSLTANIEQIKRLRKTILDLAVRGKLVDQNPADVSALELVERIATERSRLVKSGQLRKSKISPILDNPPFDLPSKWEWVHLGAIFIYDAGIKRNPKDLHVSSWLLELEDIEKDSGQLLQRIRVSERDSRSTKSEFRKDDILYGKLRPYLNKVLVADCPGYSTTEIVAIRSVLPMNSEYCALALRRPDFVGYVTRLGQGTKMPRLRTQDAVSAPFPLPPLEEQHRIVAKVDELTTLCDQLEIAVQTTISKRSSLHASILQEFLAEPSVRSVDSAKHHKRRNHG